jgi:hypothetical protein
LSEIFTAKKRKISFYISFCLNFKLSFKLKFYSRSSRISLFPNWIFFFFFFFFIFWGQFWTFQKWKRKCFNGGPFITSIWNDALSKLNLLWILFKYFEVNYFEINGNSRVQ